MENPIENSGVASALKPQMKPMKKPLHLVLKKPPVVQKKDYVVRAATETQVKPQPHVEITNNELLIRELEAMVKVSMVYRDKWREKSYRKAIESIKFCPYDIQSGRQAQQLDGIGKSIGAKIDEILAKGKLEVVTKAKDGKPAMKMDEINTICELVQINGIGPVTATNLVLDHGISKIEELYDNTELLNNTQKKGLNYFKDTNELIPRAEMIKHELLLKTIMPKDIEFIIAGSYRRGAKSSGDIDIILKTVGADHTETESYRINRFIGLIKELHQHGYLVDDLTKPNHKYNGYCKLSSIDKVRRIDLLYVSPDEFPFSLLYFTGSKHFNQKMRYMVLADGYSLNESYLTNTRLKSKVTDYVFRTEEDIFDYLGFEYVPPVLRDNTNLLVKLNHANNGAKKRTTVAPVTRVVDVPDTDKTSVTAVTATPKKRIAVGKIILKRKQQPMVSATESMTVVNTVGKAIYGADMGLKEYLTIDNMIESMKHYGGNIFQFNLCGMQISEEQAMQIKDLLDKSGMNIIIHGNVTYNFCQVNCTAFTNKLIGELIQANKLAADVVIHQGKYSAPVKAKLATRIEALDMYCHNIGYIVDQMIAKGLNNKLILENSAKQGGEFGYDIADLEYIHNSFTEEQRLHIGYCIDLCHGFTAGEMDVRDAGKMESWFDQFDKRIGVAYLRVIHFNDSNTKFDQCNDHHADLLTGYIGNRELGGAIEGYKYVAKYAKLHGIPLVIEAPETQLNGVPIAQQINYIREWQSE